MTDHTHNARSTRNRPVRLLLRVLAGTGWTVLGVLAYVVSQGSLGGYPRFHSALLTTLGMVAIAATGGIAWLLDERRPDDD
jgi:hypothetical protein